MLNWNKLHEEALNRLLKGKWQQKISVIIWFLIFLALVLIVFPILLILDEEGFSMPLPVLFLPFTVCWIVLIIITFIWLYISYKTKQNVETKIFTVEEYSKIPMVKGRKFHHPKFWNFSHYLSKALYYTCLMLAWSYFGIFIKVNIYTGMSYLVMVLVSWIPIGLIITFKQTYEMCKSQITKHK